MKVDKGLNPGVPQVLTLEAALLIVGSKLIIDLPGKYQVKATSSPTLIAERGNNQPDTWLVGINAMTRGQYDRVIAQLKSLIMDPEAAAKADYNKILSGSSLSASFVKPRNAERPAWIAAQGEIFEAVFGYVAGNTTGIGADGSTDNNISEGKEVLRVVGHNPLPLITGKKANILADLGLTPKAGQTVAQTLATNVLGGEAPKKVGAIETARKATL